MVTYTWRSDRFSGCLFMFNSFFSLILFYFDLQIWYLSRGEFNISMKLSLKRKDTQCIDFKISENIFYILDLVSMIFPLLSFEIAECNIWQIGIERISAIRLLQLTVYSDLSKPPLTQYQPLIQACCQLSFQVKTGFHHTVFLVTFYKIFQNTLCKEHQ